MGNSKNFSSKMFISTLCNSTTQASLNYKIYAGAKDGTSTR
jgi:hypothetical protein